MSNLSATPVVLDTNVLVAAGYAQSSSSRAIVRAVLAEKLAMIVSEAILREYRFILPRALRRPEFVPQLESAIQKARLIVPQPYDGIAPTDPDDVKFLAAARVVAGATIVTNDDHLLAVRDVAPVRIERPREFWSRWAPQNMHNSEREHEEPD